MERKITFAQGEYYHIYNRGVEKRKVFLNVGDYQRFQRLLYLCNSTERVIFRDVQKLPLDEIQRGEPIVALGSYALMPNHFHFCIREIGEGGISRFMEKLITGYSMYFNKRCERVGPLFQGRFKAKHIQSDEYLKYLFAYIHLNPVSLFDSAWKENGIGNVCGAQAFLESYRWSSGGDYLDIPRAEASIVSREHFPKYFNTTQDIKSFYRDWLTYAKLEEGEIL